jgi:hypothetical protein
MDNESIYITEKLMPSLLRAADEIEGAKGIAPTAGAHLEPAVLIFFEKRTLLISCSIYTEDTDVYRYQVEEPGKWKFSFPSLFLPYDLEFFPYLPFLYERIRCGEPVPAKEDDRTEIEKRIAEMYERTRLPALKGVLTELGVVCGEGVKEDGRPCLVSVEAGHVVRFSYDYTIPELELTVLVINSMDEEILIPEYKNLPPVSDYAKLFAAM